MSGVAQRSFVLLHRHGHRSPALNVFAARKARDDEINLWSKLLVQESEHDDLNRAHPIDSPHHNVNERHDVKTFPFGCLTSKGKIHMTKVGADLANRHQGLKYLTPQETQVSATNFQRTQASVQALLVGIGAHENIPVLARHIERCGMAFYNRGAAKTMDLIKTVQLTPAFVALEASNEIKEFRELMIKQFPMLATGYNGFNYFGAFDYFKCRTEHSIPLVPELQDPHLATLIDNHMAARFHLYFTHDEHIAQFIYPLLQDIKKALFTDKKLLTVFSGHDVNVLGLLYGLKLSNLLPSNYWPEYGSTVLLEADRNTKQILVWVNDLQDTPLAMLSIDELDHIMSTHAPHLNLKERYLDAYEYH